MNSPLLSKPKIDFGALVKKFKLREIPHLAKNYTHIPGIGEDP